ncbi:Glycoside hydrolase, family 28 [Corchorus capsularis]|uniref:Polygalacturonase n=1 Tax=Corchorus capsularis TaxID=210143 RepID=A0A1R3IM38_COCAP|nr:Glycoside hydrolase, family 28 [Corchorus capsularis]
MGSLSGIKVAIFVVQALLVSVALVSAQGSTNRTRWQTRSGSAPSVIARGGFSGIFSDSSFAAYSLALLTGPPDLVLWCDVQLTKDGAGICSPDIKLDNSSDIANVYKDKQKSYLLNGVSTKGWFSIDFTLKDLANVILTQGVYSRTNKFDGNSYPIMTVQDTYTQLLPPAFWLNIQHDAFYAQHNLSMRNFVLSLTRNVNVTADYISSPEVGFLQSIASRFQRSPTKLVFRFLGKKDVEPTTNQTYDSLLKNLTLIKTFASGIIVPKSYIWPVDAKQYLLPSTSVVFDAHKEGLAVYASDFANDVPFSYSYSYDPVAEYLQFVDNGNFSVDGVISDFPITPSAAINCFAHLGRNATKQVELLVISKNGASGDYPGCTDLAYSKAIQDGVDVIDCPVQITSDGIPICMSSINLIDSTTVAQSGFSNLTITIPEIAQGSGIYTFNMSWSDIQSLTPVISSPQSAYQLLRNPQFRNAGKFLTLSDFLAMAKNTSSLQGVLISIEHAPYLAEQGFGVTDAVLDALSKAGYDTTPAPQVMIQSSNSSVLMKFKGKSNYKLVYKVDEDIGGAQLASIDDIKRFASAVVISKDSVFPENSAFLTGVTDVVPRLQKANLSVYVQTFSNEFTSQAWDFFSDPTVEINSFYAGANIDGVVTDFPKTSDRYRRNRCLNKGKQTPGYMSPVQPGSLLQLVTPQYLPPAEAPNPYLTEADVAEAPLPPVASKNASTSPNTALPPSPNGQPKVAASLMAPLIAVVLALNQVQAAPQIFNVLKFGASGDGKTDNSKPFGNVWKKACSSGGNNVILIPKGTYLLRPIKFIGECKGAITFNIKGTLRAPTDNASTIGVDHWITFRYVHRLVITGGGTFDGQGPSAWPYNVCRQDPNCSLPVTLRFDFVMNSQINRITSIDSKSFHFNIFGCKDIKIQNVTIRAPGDSPNTDGIHIADSTDIQVSDSNIGTGDDCVAMGPGARNINVSNVNCGPGHGFSIGSLGGTPNELNVTKITVRNCNLTGTLCGLRIKTRAMPFSSHCSDLTFEHINVNNVTNPILIDQNYCPDHKCGPGVSKVKIEEARFRNIRGSSFSEIAVNLQCSKSTPCEKIELRDININYDGGKATSSCSNCKGVALGLQNPPPCILKS